MSEKIARFLPALLLFAGLSSLAAQPAAIQMPSDVRQMFDAWTADNFGSKGLPGWRVQISADTDRQRVEKTKTEFLTQFPDVPANWTHENPYYKLRVGAFRSRLEAQAFIDHIRPFFPGCYPAKDLAIPPAEFIQTRF
jgi:hypothetical protein